MFNRVHVLFSEITPAACSMNFWASLEYAVGVMIGSCSVIGVVGAKYRNHYAQIVMVGISEFLQCLVMIIQPCSDEIGNTIITVKASSGVSEKLLM